MLIWPPDCCISTLGRSASDATCLIASSPWRNASSNTRFSKSVSRPEFCLRRARASSNCPATCWTLCRRPLACSSTGHISNPFSERLTVGPRTDAKIAIAVGLSIITSIHSKVVVHSILAVEPSLQKVWVVGIARRQICKGKQSHASRPEATHHPGAHVGGSGPRKHPCIKSTGQAGSGPDKLLSDKMGRAWKLHGLAASLAPWQPCASISRTGSMVSLLFVHPGRNILSMGTRGPQLLVFITECNTGLFGRCSSVYASSLCLRAVS